MATIKLLYRHPETGEIEPITSDYDGPVDPIVFERFNKRFLKLDASNYFYPADSIDAYHNGIKAILETANRITSGELVLKTASPVTYLYNVGNTCLLSYHKYEVVPMRRIYRGVEAKTSGTGAIGIDSFDIDNYDGTLDSPDKSLSDIFGDPCVETLPVGTALTAQELVEELPGYPSATERYQKACAVLSELYDLILGDHERICRDAKVPPSRIVNAFIGYTLADGNFVKAAQIAHIAKKCFYRDWKRWCALAKRVGEKIRR